MCSECLPERTAGRLSDCFEYATDIGYDPAMTYSSVYRNNYLIDCWLNPVHVPLLSCGKPWRVWWPTCDRGKTVCTRRVATRSYYDSTRLRPHHLQPLVAMSVNSNDVQRLFMQAILSRRIVSQKLAAKLWEQCIEAVKGARQQPPCLLLFV